MDRYDIKAEIQRSGSTLAAIAERANIERSSLSNGLRYPIPAANRAIAAHLGKSLHELWPDWFDQTGERRTDFNARTLRTPKSSRKGRSN